MCERHLFSWPHEQPHPRPTHDKRVNISRSDNSPINQHAPCLHTRTISPAANGDRRMLPWVWIMLGIFAMLGANIGLNGVSCDSSWVPAADCSKVPVGSATRDSCEAMYSITESAKSCPWLTTSMYPYLATT